MLNETPYLLTSPETATGIARAVAALEDRVALLRANGTLTSETLSRYYGRTRIEQVAESNALEGSPLSVGETELAVHKGITILGHDPVYAQDARALAKALDRLVELSKAKIPTDVLQVKELHALVLEGRPGAGIFRNEPVRITGSEHKPPATVKEILDQMEVWERWSTTNATVSPLLRAAVSHAWLTQIHPFVDGNGRTARAVNNLELIRAGFPPIIIRKNKDKPRYLDALRAADGGDLGFLLDLVLDRAEDALRDLERAAREGQGYDAAVQKVRRAQQNRLATWSTAVELLAKYAFQTLDARAQALGGTAELEVLRDTLDLDDYLALCELKAIPRSWLFRLQLRLPGLAAVERLAWAGYRSEAMRDELAEHGKAVSPGPALFWSRRNAGSYPPWVQLRAAEAPGGAELTLVGEQWFVRRESRIVRMGTADLGEAIASGLIDSAS